MRRAVLGGLLTLTTLGGTDVRAQSSMASHVVTLPPSAFPDLNTDVRGYLEAQRCRVPQTFVSRKPHNVIRGRFFSAGEMDTAVICARGETERTLVFRGDSPARLVVFSKERHLGPFQGIGSQATPGYSHYIGVATRTLIFNLHGAFGGPKPPPIDHDGISDGFAEKASIIMYWYRGTWIQLQGAD